METPSQKMSLQEQQDAFRSKTFRMMIHVALIFGIPAAIAAFAGTRLDAQAGEGKTWTVALLVVSFIVSWVLTIGLYMKLNKEARELDAKARAAKEQKQSRESNN